MFTLNCNGRLLIVDKPLVMGIINITPDSFYEGSRQQTIPAVLERVGEMLRDGADILDIGGQSTRPGSQKVSEPEELDRVLEPLKAIVKEFPDAIISIDTYYAGLARACADAGAGIINDISGGQLDPAMIDMVATLKLPYVLMHMKDTPQTMHRDPVYTDVTLEVLDYFIAKIAMLRERGIHDIIIDPGFGFAKTIAHNFELLRKLSSFSIIDAPLLLGISRKSTIYKTLGIDASEALNGTTALHMAGLINGAKILRVHDVKEAVQTVKLFNAFEGEGLRSKV